MTLRDNKQLISDIVSLAYKVLPLPSGCANCWGDLHEGCTDECKRSSQQHSERVQALKDGMIEIIEKYSEDTNDTD